MLRGENSATDNKLPKHSTDDDQELTLRSEKHALRTSYFFWRRRDVALIPFECSRQNKVTTGTLGRRRRSSMDKSNESVTGFTWFGRR